MKFPDYWSMWEQKLDITYELASREDRNIFVSPFLKFYLFESNVRIGKQIIHNLRIKSHFSKF